jgi:hypothetical protein
MHLATSRFVQGNHPKPACRCLYQIDQSVASKRPKVRR